MRGSSAQGNLLYRLMANAKSSIGGPMNEAKRTMARSAPRTWATTAITVPATK